MTMPDPDRTLEVAKRLGQLRRTHGRGIASVLLQSIVVHHPDAVEHALDKHARQQRARAERGL